MGTDRVESLCLTLSMRLAMSLPNPIAIRFLHARKNDRFTNEREVHAY